MGAGGHHVRLCAVVPRVFRPADQCVGLVAQATSYAAHAVLAARGEWITNEKTLLNTAGLRCVDEFVAAVQPDPDALRDMVDRSRAACLDALDEARG